MKEEGVEGEKKDAMKTIRPKQQLDEERKGSGRKLELSILQVTQRVMGRDELSDYVF